MLKRKENNVELYGVVKSEPVFNHSIAGESFFIFYIDCKRTSGVIDSIPCMISDRTVNIKEFSDLITKFYIHVTGEYRTYRKSTKIMNDDGSYKWENHTDYYVLIDTVNMYENKNQNEYKYNNCINLIGSIVKTPNYRLTPNGREICELILKIPRSYTKEDYVCCIVWGKNAKYANTLTVGSTISVTGRIQSRDVIKTINNEEKLYEHKTVYDISVSMIQLMETPE